MTFHATLQRLYTSQHCFNLRCATSAERNVHCDFHREGVYLFTGLHPPPVNVHEIATKACNLCIMRLRLCVHLGLHLLQGDALARDLIREVLHGRVLLRDYLSQ